jgi:hypothetical protein
MTKTTFNLADWLAAGCFIDSEALDMPSEVSARLYLDFAIRDLAEQDSIRTHVNAVSNAKRSLHFQVKTLSDALGFKQTGQKDSFPNRLGFCEKCGLLAPRILAKLNRLRNTQEHECYLPTRDEAEDFVDVVTLFLAATDRWLTNFPSSAHFEGTADGYLSSWSTHHLFVELKPGTGVVALTMLQTTLEPEQFAAAVHEEESLANFRCKNICV